jgi:hypothetical protein
MLFSKTCRGEIGANLYLYSYYFNGNNLWGSVSELNNNIINDTK